MEGRIFRWVKNYLKENIELTDCLLSQDIIGNIGVVSSNFVKWREINKRRPSDKKTNPSKLQSSSYISEPSPYKNRYFGIKRNTYKRVKPQPKLFSVSENSEKIMLDKIHNITKNFANIRKKYKKKREWYKKINILSHYGFKRYFQTKELDKNLTVFNTTPTTDNLKKLLNVIIANKTSIANENKRMFKSSLNIVLDDLTKQIINSIGDNQEILKSLNEFDPSMLEQFRHLAKMTNS